jgi:hypothetical protein
MESISLTEKVKGLTLQGSSFAEAIVLPYRFERAEWE